MKFKIENESREMYRDPHSKAISLNVTSQQVKEYNEKKNKILQEKEWKDGVDNSINNIEQKIGELSNKFDQLIELLKGKQ